MTSGIFNLVYPGGYPDIWVLMRLPRLYVHFHEVRRVHGVST